MLLYVPVLREVTCLHTACTQLDSSMRFVRENFVINHVPSAEARLDGRVSSLASGEMF